MDTINLNIALKPSNESLKKLLEISNLFRNQKNLEFLVDNRSFIFHLTLYQTIFPIESLDEIKKTLDKFKSDFDIFNFLTLNLINVEKAVWLALADSKELNTIHNFCLNKFSDLRSNLIPEKYKDDSEKYLSLNKKQQQMVKDYGNPYVKTERSTPHITLCEFSEETNDMTINGILNDYFLDFQKVTFDKIMLCESGDHGTCVKILHEIKLY
jgi:2'-5' RNA ligase